MELESSILTKPKFLIVPFIIFAVSVIVALVIYQKPESVDTINGKMFFGSILAASATILAISFSLSQYLVTRIGDLYSPYIIRYYRDSKITRITFISFVCTVIFSAILLGGKFEEGMLYSGLVWITLIIFVFSISFFSRFFIMIITTVNPIEFASEIRKIAKDSIEEKTNFQNVITSIGDTIAKSIERHEVRIAQEYIRVLDEIAAHYLELKTNLKAEIKSDYEEQDVEKINENPLYQILQQLKRTYKIAYQREEGEVTRHIITISDGIMYKTMKENNNDDLLRIFISNPPFETFFHNLQKITSQDLRDRDEKKLLLHKLVFHAYPFSTPAKVKPEYLEHIVPKSLFNLAQIIIDSNDFDSFKQLTESSTYLSARDPMDAINNMMDSLLYSTTDPDLNRFHLQLDSHIKIYGCWDFDAFKKYMKFLDDYKDILIEKNNPQEQTETTVERLKINIWNIYYSSLVHKAFFWIGAYLLFKKKIDYLDQLWEVTNPKEDNTMYTNHPPLSTSSTWICQFLRTAEMESISATPDFGAYQSPTGFFFKYFGLIQGKSPDNFDFPSKYEIERMISYGDTDLLAEWYNVMMFLSGDSFLDFTKNLFEYIDVEKFTKKEFGQLEINQRMKSLIEKAKEIQRVLEELAPIISEKITQFAENAIRKYEETTEMENLSNVKIVSKLSHKKSSFYNAIYYPKSPFTVLGQFWVDTDPHILEIINYFEHDVLAQSIIDLKPKSKRKNFGKRDIVFEETFEDMVKFGYEPDYVMMSRNLMSKILSHGGNMGQISLKTKNLQIVISNIIPKNQMYFVSKSEIDTKYLSKDGRKISVEIVEYDDDKTRILIKPSIDISISINNKNAVRRVTLSSIPD